MSKSILLFVGLLALTQATTLTSDNYEGLKTFVQGFLTGYNGSNTRLPDLCLTESAQAKLDEDIVATFTYLLRGHPQDALDSFRNFVMDLEGMMKDCGLDTVITHFNVDVSKNGFFWVIQNILFNYFNLEAQLADTLEYLILGKWNKAGASFGKFFNFLAPLNMQSTPIAPTDITALVDAFLQGLEADPKTPGKCYTDLSGTTSLVTSVIYDAERCLAGDEMAFEQLLVDLKELYTTVKGIKASDCDFSGLFAALKAASKDTIMLNYMKHLLECTKDLGIVKSCSTDFAKCGNAAGELFRLLIGWSLK